MFNRLTPAVKNLMIINGIMFLLSLLTAGKAFDIQELGALRHPMSSEFRIWQPLTHMFLHGSFGHIFSNMLGLLFLGPLLEQVWGTKRFYIFYFVCGFGASVLHIGVQTWEILSFQEHVDFFMQNPTAGTFAPIYDVAANIISQPSPYGVMRALQDGTASSIDVENAKKMAEFVLNFKKDIKVVGASGAIYGILLGAAMLFPNTKVYIYFLFPVKLKWVALALAGLAIYNALGKTQDGVAHWAHLGGMIFAFILIKIWDSNKYRFY